MSDDSEVSEDDKVEEQQPECNVKKSQSVFKTKEFLNANLKKIKTYNVKNISLLTLLMMMKVMKTLRKVHLFIILIRFKDSKKQTSFCFSYQLKNIIPLLV